MSAGEPFIDISVREGTLFKKSETTKRVFLPLSWQVNQNKWKTLALPFFLSIYKLVGVGLIHNGWIITGIASIMYFSFIAYIMGRSRVARLRIGPGRVTIDKDGFSDDRLGPDRIPWHGLQVRLTRHSRAGGPPVGLLLESNYDIVPSKATVSLKDYKRAYFLVSLETRRIVFIDFADQQNGIEIEKVIRALVKAAECRGSSQRELRFP